MKALWWGALGHMVHPFALRNYRASPAFPKALPPPTGNQTRPDHFFPFLIDEFFVLG